MKIRMQIWKLNVEGFQSFYLNEKKLIKENFIFSFHTFLKNRKIFNFVTKNKKK